MEQQLARVFVTHGMNLDIQEPSGPYAVARWSTGKVVSSNLKPPPETLEPGPSVTGTHGSGQIPMLPPTIYSALLVGWRLGYVLKFVHHSVVMDLPPGFRARMLIRPPEGIEWLTWALTFGELVDSRVVIVHEHPELMAPHEDYLIYSLVSHVYPFHTYITTARPHIVSVHNRADVTRTVEVTIWMLQGDHRSMEWLFGLLENTIRLIERSPELARARRLPPEVLATATIT